MDSVKIIHPRMVPNPSIPDNEVGEVIFNSSDGYHVFPFKNFSASHHHPSTYILPHSSSPTCVRMRHLVCRARAPSPTIEPSLDARAGIQTLSPGGRSLSVSSPRLQAVVTQSSPALRGPPSSATAASSTALSAGRGGRMGSSAPHDRPIP